MSPGIIALLAGLFIVPLALLALGHRLRRRTPAQRAMFWGGLVGYLIAALGAMWVGMMPAAEWSESDTARGLIGFWGLIIGPLVGALTALVLFRDRQAD
jgi:hypothetical protein